MTDYQHPANGGGYGSTPPPGRPGPAQRPAAGGTPWWKLWWVIGIAALVLGVIIGAASAGGSKKAAAAAPSTVTNTATATVSVTKPGATVTARPVVTNVVRTKTRTETETYTPPPAPTFSDGTYQAGSDIKPGRYHTDGGDDCYYEVDRNLNGGIDDIVANDNISGAAYASVKDGQYLKVSGGCDWSKT